MLEEEVVEVEDKRKPPEKYAREHPDYIRIPFPFAYAVACIEATQDLNPGETGPTNGMHASQTTYSKPQIAEVLRFDKQVQRDLDRTKWTFNDNKGRVFFNESYLHKMPFIPENLEGYINSYILAEDTDTLSYVTEGLNGAPQAEEVNIGDMEKFKDDLLRINPENNNDVPLSKEEDVNNLIKLNGGHTLAAIHTMREESKKEEGLHLTPDEAQALYAFGCTVKNEQSLKATGLQGGLFDNTPNAGIFRWASNSVGILIQKLSKNRERHVTRSHDNKLNVLFSTSSDSIDLPNGETEKAKPNRPFLFYSSQYEVNQEGENFTCTRMDNAKSRTLFIEPDFFYKHLMPAAKKRLEEVNFAADLNELNDHNQSLKQDLLFFIPLLSNHEFLKLFSDKLRNSKTKPKTLEFLLDHMKLCFSEPSILWQPPAFSFWERHQNKIIYSLMGLALAAVVIGTSILTFGLPAIFAAVGGAIIFGSIAAGSGAALAGMGVLIGKYTDDRRIHAFESIEKGLVLKLIRAIETHLIKLGVIEQKKSISPDTTVTSTSSSLLDPDKNEVKKVKEPISPDTMVTSTSSSLLDLDKNEVKKVEDKVEYVSIPFPFAYGVAYTDATTELKPGETSPTDGLHTSQTTYSRAEIAKILRFDEQVQKDLHRTNWALENEEDQSFAHPCYFHVRPAMPKNLDDYINSYILVQGNLSYVTWNLETGKSQVEPVDFNIENFKESLSFMPTKDESDRINIRTFLERLNSDSEIEADILLSPGRIYDLIVSKGGYTLSAIHNLQESSNSNTVRLFLTPAEAQALYAFKLSVRSEKSLEGTGAQQGQFDQPVAAVFGWAAESVHISIAGLDHREDRITRDNHNKINVSFSMKSNLVLLPDGSAERSADKPLFLYSNHYKIDQDQQGENFTCTRMDDPKSRTLLIEKEFFNNHLMRLAKEKLAEVDFSAPLNQDLKKNLLFFIPLLSNPEFDRLFFNKLRSSAVTPETNKFLSEHTELCFGEPIVPDFKKFELDDDDKDIVTFDIPDEVSEEELEEDKTTSPHLPHSKNADTSGSDSPLSEKSSSPGGKVYPPPVSQPSSSTSDEGDVPDSTREVVPKVPTKIDPKV